MMIKLSLLAGLLVILTARAQASNGHPATYQANVPKHIRPGFDVAYDLWLAYDIPVQVRSMLHSDDDLFSLESVDVVNNGHALINLGKLPLDYSGSTKFVFNFTAFDAETGEMLLENSTTMFTFESKALSILIQTDKAIYQPGETIRFRAACLTPDLRPLTGDVTYQVKDPNGNIVLLEENMVLSHGVAGGQLALNKDAENGEWEISFMAKEYKETLLVTVRFYKLPKFEVTLTAPSYIHPGSVGFTVTMDAKYTFGQPVKGSATLLIEMQPRYGRAFNPSSISKTYRKFDGSVREFITMEEIMGDLGWDGESEMNIEVTGHVTERFTDIIFNDTATINVERTNIKVENLYKPDTIKPGLLYTAYVQVTEQDGKPLTEEDRLNNHLIVEVEYRYPFRSIVPRPIDSALPDGRSLFPQPRQSERETLVYKIPPNGIVVVSLTSKPDKFSTVSFRPYTNATEKYGRYSNQWEANRAESPSDSFVQIMTDDSNVAPGDMADLTIKTTEAVSHLKIMVIARGTILSQAMYTTQSGLPEKDHSYQLRITEEMMPSVNFLVSHIRSDGEIVADYLTLTVSLSLENQVTMSSSAMTVDAGDDVSIRVQTSSQGSYVGLRAIDQSVLLLKSGNDITKERVRDDLNEYSVSDDSFYGGGGIFRWWFPRPSGAKDAKLVFEGAGIIALTDGLIFQSEPDFGPFPLFFQRGVNGAAERLPVAFSATSVQAPTPTRTRTFFPETWIWDDSVTGADGSATFDTKAPDTITSWVLSAFSISDEHGLGVADTSKITVFRQFFVSLNLPVKVTRGEIMIVQAIVFNYQDSDVTARLTLTLDEGLTLIRPGDDPEAAGPVRTLDIPRQGSVSVKFPVRSTALGELGITAQAVTDLVGDALTRTVYVRPGGIEQCYSASALFNRESDREETTREELEIKLPSGIVPESGKVTLYVYGDILGGTMNNLGRLLKMPSGCGEQNMLGFAPDVFVTLYLERAGTLDAETQRKAFQHFQTGYMNQLKYMLSDGSYSAFGARDKVGSTWLTAFVAKCFIFARELRPTLVETRIVDKALEFLVALQSADGSFMERGRVIHSTMQGGVDSNITMTAYVLITLRETPYPIKNKKIEQAAAKARAYLENNLSMVMDNKYALALVTYALHVSESDRAGAALTALEAVATTTGGLTYWTESSRDASMYRDDWRPPYRKPPSNDIEMTAYALLTYVRREDLGSAAPVMKWITSKQNELGGYSSTQDTVIAIQALSQVAALLTGREQDMTITAAHSEDDSFLESFNIDDSNSIVLQSAMVPPVDGDLVVTADGVGIGVAQLSVCYNIPNNPYIDEPFNCTVDVSSDDINSASINFCCALAEGETEPTGMFLFEIGLLNGFTADVVDEEERNPTAQMVEVDEDSVNVYYNQLAPGKGLCAKAVLLRFADVGESKPATLQAFEYYKPDKKVSRLYSVDGLSTVTPCQVCGSDCVGCPAPQLGDWKPWQPCVEFCKPETTTRSRSCVDPSLNKEVNIGKCGLDEVPIQTRMCESEGLQCPDFYHGLWFNLPPGFARYDPKSRCSYLGGRLQGPTSGIPGATLDGQTYVRCNKPEEALPGENGFTISILVKPVPYVAGKSYTFIAFAGEGSRPVFEMQKLWWKDELRFNLRHENYSYTVRRFDTSSIPPNVWTHVVITWHRDQGAKVYINGISVGVASRALVSRRRDRGEKKYLYIGRNGYRNTARRGSVSGSFSSLNYFDQVLDESNLMKLSSFFMKIVDHDGPEPLLTPRYLRMFSPPQLRFCFDESVFLSALYAETTEANRKCGRSPFLIGPIPIF
ncbi:CD109 antigen-like isoform X2 [Clavelina lepadiformis]|uniref:CD109 antigen-like isoform X2 n=1 Tax=Clavelina lepadiformis TaxID=159417 RepID=UPI0040420C2E